MQTFNTYNGIIANVNARFGTDYELMHIVSDANGIAFMRGNEFVTPGMSAEQAADAEA